MKGKTAAPPAWIDETEEEMRLNTPIGTTKIFQQVSLVHSDVVLTIGVSLALFAVLQFEPQMKIFAVLRLLFGLAYVFFFPGYWLSVVFFPGADDLEPVQRIAISFGLSVAWVPVLALILDHLWGGLNLGPIFFSEYFSISAFMVLALLRQSRLASPHLAIPRFSWDPLSHPHKLTYGAALGSLALGLLLVARVFLVPSPAEYMTEFYVMQKNGLAENYPRQARLGEQLQIILGVNNREQSDHTYRVETWVEDVWSSGKLKQVAQSENYEINPGQNQEWTLTWQMPWEGSDQKVLFLLFIDDETEPYRQLQLFLNVGAK